MQNLLPKHLLIQKKKMIQFRIDETIAHSQIPIFDKHGVLFQIMVGVQEEKHRSAGKRSLYKKRVVNSQNIGPNEWAQIFLTTGIKNIKNKW